MQKLVARSKPYWSNPYNPTTPHVVLDFGRGLCMCRNIGQKVHIGHIACCWSLRFERIVWRTLRHRRKSWHHGKRQAATKILARDWRRANQSQCALSKIFQICPKSVKFIRSVRGQFRSAQQAVVLCSRAHAPHTLRQWTPPLTIAAVRLQYVRSTLWCGCAHTHCNVGAGLQA